MNLLNDPWIPVRRRSGARERIRPADITSRWHQDPIVALASPRADFDGALIQFLIGLVQTRFAPRSSQEWRKRFDDPPLPDELHSRWAGDAYAFALDGDGPRFMQALELAEDDSTPDDISHLLIETPGAQGMRFNTDLFVHRRSASALCVPCAATALFSLQTNSPAGGRGTRTGLRGGGPLTTLVMSDDLWSTTWLAVLTQDSFLAAGYGNPDRTSPEDRFPWLAPTRTSEKGLVVRPDDVHPAQVFWSLPRRLRLVFQDSGTGLRCLCCGDNADRFVIALRSKPSGVNYWEQAPHPLSPYRATTKDLCTPVHGSASGITYRDWVGMVVEDTDGARRPAHVIRSFYSDAHRRRRGGYRLWTFGFDMDNAKARRWVEARTPLLLPEVDGDADAGGDRDETFSECIRALIRLSEFVRTKLTAGVKQALARRPKDLRGDFGFLFHRFMERTDGPFFEAQRALLSTLDDADARDDVLRAWHRLITRTALEIFGETTQAEQISALDAGRVARAWNDLRKNLFGKRAWQALGLPKPPKKPLALSQDKDS